MKYLKLQLIKKELVVEERIVWNGILKYKIKFSFGFNEMNFTAFPCINSWVEENVIHFVQNLSIY